MDPKSFLTLYPGSGAQDGKKWIRYKHPESATLHKCMKGDLILIKLCQNSVVVKLSDIFHSSRICWRKIFVKTLGNTILAFHFLWWCKVYRTVLWCTVNNRKTAKKVSLIFAYMLTFYFIFYSLLNDTKITEYAMYLIFKNLYSILVLAVVLVYLSLYAKLNPLFPCLNRNMNTFLVLPFSFSELWPNRRGDPWCRPPPRERGAAKGVEVAKQRPFSWRIARSSWRNFPSTIPHPSQYWDTWARIFKLLRSPRINRLHYSLAARYDNPIPSRFLASIECLKIPALETTVFSAGIFKQSMGR